MLKKVFLGMGLGLIALNGVAVAQSNSSGTTQDSAQSVTNDPSEQVESLLRARGVHLAPPGYHYELGSFTPTPNDACESSFVNSKGILSWINSSIGQPQGVGQAVVSIVGSSDAAATDLIALNLPATGAGSASLACYATLQYQDGTTHDGLFEITDPGSNLPLQVTWVDRSLVEQARTAREASLQHSQQDAIAYASKLQVCTFEWQIGVEAKSLLASGWSSIATTDHLINEHAHGSNGQTYRGSDDAAEIIRRVTYAVATTPHTGAANHIPDYASQQFLSACSTLARQ